MRIQDLLGSPVISCDPDTTLAEAAASMAEHDVGCLAIMQAGSLIGLITERDLLPAVARQMPMGTTAVRGWMTSEPDTVDPDVDVEQAAEWILATGYRHLPVKSGSEIVGIVSIKDLLWAVTDQEAVR